MIRRRHVLASVATLLSQRAANAQVTGRVYRVGYLGYTATNTPQDLRTVDAFFQRLRELGYVEGRNLVVEQRFAEGRNERYTALAAELVQWKADVIVVTSGTAARASSARAQRQGPCAKAPTFYHRQPSSP